MRNNTPESNKPNQKIKKKPTIAPSNSTEQFKTNGEKVIDPIKSQNNKPSKLSKTANRHQTDFP